MATFPFGNHLFGPELPRDDIEDEDMYSSFPNFPRLRHPRKYEADGIVQGDNQADPEQNMTPEDLCTKKAYSHASLHPGERFSKQQVVINNIS